MNDYSFTKTDSIAPRPCQVFSASPEKSPPEFYLIILDNKQKIELSSFCILGSRKVADLLIRDSGFEGQIN
jgi:hypothetical protein